SGGTPLSCWPPPPSGVPPPSGSAVPPPSPASSPGPGPKQPSHAAAEATTTRGTSARSRSRGVRSIRTSVFAPFSLHGSDGAATSGGRDDCATRPQRRGGEMIAARPGPRYGERFLSIPLPEERLLPTRQGLSPVRRHTLDNGVSVVLLESRAAPVVALQVWVDVG